MMADLDRAEELYREALDAQRETLGNRHADTLTSINNLAIFEYQRGNIEHAKTLCREAVDGARATLGDAHPNTQVFMRNLAQWSR